MKSEDDMEKWGAGMAGLIRVDIADGRWGAVSEGDMRVSCDESEVEVVAVDGNGHAHRFVAQRADGEGVRLMYFHCAGERVARSFVDYVACYLEYWGFCSVMSRCGQGLSFAVSIEDAHEGMLRLMDVVLSRLKPMGWFYEEEPAIETFEEAFHYLASVCSLVRLESCRGRWPGVRPENIKMERLEDEAYIELTYAVDGVWEISMYATASQCVGSLDLECSLLCYVDRDVPEEMHDSLHAAFADFLDTLEVAKHNIYVGCHNDHSARLQYFHIEDTFGAFCSMLDQAVPALLAHSFRLPSRGGALAEEMARAKRQAEEALGMAFEIVDEESEISKKLKNGSFLA